jgi:hypothetical protein
VTSGSSGVGPATIRFTVAPAQVAQLYHSATLNIAGNLFHCHAGDRVVPGQTAGFTG